MPGAQELVVIAVVALVAVGPERLPRVARDTATLLARLRPETTRAVDEVRDAVRIHPPSDEE